MAADSGRVRPTGVLERMPASSFLRVTRKDVPSDQRAALVRKGNQLYAEGKYDVAERIFLTVHYSDGLVRLGDYYREQGRTLDALRMFWLAPDETRKEAVMAEMAAVVSKWLREDGDG